MLGTNYLDQQEASKLRHYIFNRLKGKILDIKERKKVTYEIIYKVNSGSGNASMDDLIDNT